MTTTPHVYLCPQCGEVILATPAATGGVNCPSCQENFSSRNSRSEVIPTSASAVSRDITSHLKSKNEADTAETEQNKQASALIKTALLTKKRVASPNSVDSEQNVTRHRKKRSKRNNNPFYLILLAWFSLLITVVLIFRYGQTDDFHANDGIFSKEIQERQVMIQRNQRFVKIHLEDTKKVVDDYLDSINPIERQQVIDNPIELASVFARYYEINQIEILSTNRRAAQANVIDTPFGPAMEVVWIDEQQRALETLMLWDGDEWRIDWEQMVRYSDTPWNLFQSGLGDAEGTFRVYARRQTSEDKENMRIVFYGPWPKAFRPDSAMLKNLAIPTISIPIDSKLGKEMEKIFADQANIPAYKQSAFTFTDPDGFVRLTARLKYTPDKISDVINYELLSIISSNWHGRRLQQEEKKEAEQKAKKASVKEAEPKKAQAPKL